MSVVQQIRTSEEFNNLSREYMVVVVDIFGTWCSPCTSIAPKYEEIARQFSSNQVVFVKYDIDTPGPKLFNDIQGLPSFLFFQGGKEIEHSRVNGADVDRILNVLNQLQLSKNPSAQQSAVKPVSSTLGIPVSGYRGKSSRGNYKKGNY